jgi:sugar lactone lactonase YvrE
MPTPLTLKTGLAFGESPRWHDDRLWLSDWGTREIVAVDTDGSSEVVGSVPSAPACIDWLPDGRLLVVSGGEGLLLRRENDGSLVTHADLSGLSPHAWNEIVVDGYGRAYVNNIGFEFGGDFAPGIIAMVTQDGSASVVAEGIAFPNGMVHTPDSSTLIVAESYGNTLTAFEVAPDGRLKNRRVWAELGEGVPDGICLDAEGAIWYGDVPNKRCVRVREGGEVLDTVGLDRGCFACALGGPDGTTLFMVAAEWPEAMSEGSRTGRVLAAEVSSAGVGWSKSRSKRR